METAFLETLSGGVVKTNGDDVAWFCCYTGNPHTTTYITPPLSAG